jgi:hypothetical protein
VSKKPISKGPSFFIQVFRLGDEIQFGDIYARGTDQVAEVASNTEVNPFLDGTLPWSSESLRTRTCLLGPWKFWGHSRNRTDRHAGRTTDANVHIILGPRDFVRFLHRKVVNQAFLAFSNPNSQMPNSKYILNPILNDQNPLTLSPAWREEE